MLVPRTDHALQAQLRRNERSEPVPSKLKLAAARQRPKKIVRQAALRDAAAKLRAGLQEKSLRKRVLKE